MVKVGDLVKEECSIDRIGTVVKITDLVLHENSQWKHDLERWKKYNERISHDPRSCWVIRPGQVASVRWQDDPSRLTVHVFYSDCRGASSFSYGSNQVEVVVG